MKTSTLAVAAAVLLTLTAVTVTDHSDAASLCGKQREKCGVGLQPVCRENAWECIPRPTNYTAPACGPNNVRCETWFQPACVNGGWICKSVAAPESCIAYCPNGTWYPTCNADGQVIDYFADPCLGQERYSSSASSESSVSLESSESSSSAPSEPSVPSVPSDCGPNPLFCAINAQPVCTDGVWTCELAEGSMSSMSSRTPFLTIESVLPLMAWPGGNVTIEGTGFAKQGNIVLFEDSVIPFLRSLDGTHLTFRLPKSTSRACYFSFSSTMRRCKAPKRTYGPGAYRLSVRTGDKTSNAVTITLK